MIEFVNIILLDHVIVGDEVTGRAEAVAVQHSSGKASVTEQPRGRSVPRFH